MITAIKGFTRWMVASRPRRADSDPLFGMKKLNASADVRVEEDAESHKLLTATRKAEPIRGLTGEDRADLYTVAAYTGLRASELASLLPVSFSLEGEPVVNVAAGYTKIKKRATLPLMGEVAELIRDFVKGKAKDVALWPQATVAS